MEPKDFIQNFAAQFDETDPGLLELDTKFRELDEWSSLIALTVMAMVDEEYGVKLKGEEMRAAQTVRDLFDIVKSRI